MTDQPPGDMRFPEDPAPSADSNPQSPAVSPNTPDSPAAKRKIPPWAWIVGTVLIVLLLLGWYQGTQTTQGKLWVLGLRGMVQVPLVVGQTQSQAQATLENAGLRLGQVSQEQTLAVPPGVVTSQSPSPAQDAKKDSGVNISVAAIPTVKVPNVVDQTQSNAVTVLAEQGLRTGVINYVYDSGAAAGSVTAQDPAASSETTVGSAVALTVSKGTQQGQVPNVIGLSQDDANSVITADGFKITTVKATSTSVAAGDVSAQSPSAGVVAPTGSTVTITVSTGAPPAPAPPAPPSTPSTTPQTPAPPTTPPATPEPTPVTKVPDVVGMGVTDAVTTLKKAQLKVSFEYAPSTEDILKVAAQDPSAGTSVDPGTTVTITIGLPSASLPDGKPTTPVPLPIELPAKKPPGSAKPAPQPAPVPQPSVPST